MNITKNKLFLSLVLFATFNAAGYAAMAHSAFNATLTWCGLANGFAYDPIQANNWGSADKALIRGLATFGFLVGDLFIAEAAYNRSSDYIGHSLTAFCGRFILATALGMALSYGGRELANTDTGQKVRSGIAQFLDRPAGRWTTYGLLGVALIAIGRNTGS
jgi:hypothetical protein